MVISFGGNCGNVFPLGAGRGLFSKPLLLLPLSRGIILEEGVSTLMYSKSSSSSAWFMLSVMYRNKYR